MFFIAHSHNAIGRFYEVQSYGPDNNEVRPGATTTSREWFRPNPPLPSIKWGPRNNTNIQQSACSSRSTTSRRTASVPRELLAQEQARGREGQDRPDRTPGSFPPRSAARRDAADAVNELRRQGLEVHTANAAFKAAAST